MGPATALACSAALAACALAQSGGARQPGEVRIRSAPYHPLLTTISVETNLVELGVAVRDLKGALTAGLQESDFQIFDNSKRQEIAFFSEQRAAPPSAAPASTAQAGSPAGLPSASSSVAQPRYLALFFDDTHAGPMGFETSRRAAQKLITNGLRPTDRIGIFTASGTPMRDFTADTKALLDTLFALRRHPDRGVDKGFGVCPTLTAYQAYMIARHLDIRAKMIATAEVMACEPGIPEDIAAAEAQSAAETAWDMLRHQSSDEIDTLLQVARHLAAAPGVRILLMVSPGFATGGMERQTSALTDTCLRAHIVINSLHDEGLLTGADSPEALGDRSGMRANWAERTIGLRTQMITALMAEASASTGGEFFHNSNDLITGMRTLADPPEISYLLGFSPLEKPDGKYHKLKVSLAKSGFTATARPGYFSTVREDPPETAQRRIDRLVSSGESLDQVPATVKVSAIPESGERSRIQVDITIDAKRLLFRGRNGSSVQQLTFVTVLETPAGKYLEGKQAVMDLALTAPTRADLEEKGIKAETSFLVPKGDYQVREVIREAVQNQLSASNSSIEVR